jgi:hypothetical protein
MTTIKESRIMSSNTQDIDNLNLHAFSDFNPAASEMRAELEKLRNEAENKAIIAINWYLQRKSKEKAWSQRLRLGAIILASLGGLMPLLQSLLPYAGQAGYVLLGMAAACVAVDKFFGFSSAWMRYMTTEIALQRDLAEFQMDWMMLSVELGAQEPDAAMKKHMLARLKTFRLQTLNQLHDEMQLWVHEFHNSLAQLEKTAKIKTDDD